MPNARLKSVLLILLCSAFSIVTGRWLDQSSGAGTSSYRAVYYGARCLLQHADPYNPDEFSRIYMAESGALPRDPAHRPRFLRAVMVCVNLPTTLFLLIPLALLPWGLSHVLWLALIAISLTTAAVLAYDLCAEHAGQSSRLPLVLICLLMANCQVLFTVANTAGVAVGLCVISVWCFVRRRFEWIGIFALAISLALKPHDSGLIWIWLLVSGGVLRKRSLQTAALVAVIALPAVLVIAHSSPHWSTELRGNLAATSAHGDISDPGPESNSWQGSADVIISLQTALSLFRDDPHFYNPATYLVCGSLLIIWLIPTLRREPPLSESLLALAFVAALTMLVSYHRPYDSKLLLLAIPATSMLRYGDDRWRRPALIVATFAVFFTSDLPLAFLTLITRSIRVPRLVISERILLSPILRPTPISLLLMAVVFLFVYLRTTPVDTPELNPAHGGSR
jgi:hypothetical protein